MFTWTVATLLCAIDAGIQSIVTEYNAQYTAFVAARGPVVCKGGYAHTVVVNQMVADLNYVEARLFVHSALAAVDHAVYIAEMDAEYYGEYAFTRNA